MYYSHIVIHHSLTRDSSTVSWDGINRYHTRELGWDDIGYHFGIERVGDEYLCFVGRPLGKAGAHCIERGMNRKGIGICCVGNYDLAPPPDEMLEALVRRLVRPLMSIFGIPRENIAFHREFATYKSCPGKLFRKEHILNLL